MSKITLVAITAVTIIMAGCYAEPKSISNLDHDSVTINYDTQCKAQAPTGSTYQLQLRLEVGQGDWDDFGHPVHPFTCPADADPNTDGYQCSGSPDCQVIHRAEAFEGIKCGSGGQFYSARAFHRFPNGQEQASSEIRFETAPCP